MLCPRPYEPSVDFIGRVHGFELIEFPDRLERCALITAGTGLMLSLMDASPRLRWCVDADGFRPEQIERLGAWMTCLGNVTDLVVVAGWYCSTNPAPLAAAVRRLNKARTLSYVQCRGLGADPFDGLRTAHSLAVLISQVNTFELGATRMAAEAL